MRKALVTGGSRGIGRAIVESLARNGYEVTFTWRSAESQAGELLSKLQDYPVSALHLKLESLRFGGLEEFDILVNNAGYSEEKPFLRLTDQEWMAMLTVGLIAPAQLAQVLLPGMLKREWGRIINIASVGGIWGGVYQVHYAAAKAGLINLSKSLARLYSNRGVTSNAVCPGVVATDMLPSRYPDIPMARPGLPGEVASLVTYLCSDGAGYITGQTLNVDGGMVR